MLLTSQSGRKDTLNVDPPHTGAQRAQELCVETRCGSALRRSGRRLVVGQEAGCRAA